MFTIKESFKYGWETFKSHLEIALLSTLLTLGVGILTESRHVIGLLATVFLIIVQIGYFKIFLRINDGENPTFSDIFKEFKKIFWKYLGLSLVVGAVVGVGTVLFIIPGLILATRLIFSTFILIDTNISITESIKESWAITKGNFWKILLLLCSVCVVNIIGAMLFYVVLLVTIPVSTWALIYVYRKLSQARASLIIEVAPEETKTTV